MAINFGILSQIPEAKTIATMQPSGGEGGGDDFGSIFSGLGQLFGGKKAPQAPGTAPINPMNGVSNIENTYSGQSLLGGNPVNGKPRMEQLINNNFNQQGLQLASTLLGKNEGKDYEVLSNFLSKSTGQSIDPRTTPWCAAFTNAILQSTGFKGTNSLSAKSFLGFGNPTNNPSMGDIVVLNRGNDPNLGHVGFFSGYDHNGNVKILGGNQDNSVSIKSFPVSSVAGFRTVPSGDQIAKNPITQQFGQQNPQAASQLMTKSTSQVMQANQQPSPLQQAITGITYVESRSAKDPYSLVSKASKNGDRAYGYSQIMGKNIPSWTKEATGTAYTPEQFLANPNIQKATTEYHVGKLLNQYGNLDDVASAWFSGRPVDKAGNAKDAYGTSVPQYIKLFKEGISKGNPMKVSMNTPDFINGVGSTMADPIKKVDPLTLPGQTSPEHESFTKQMDSGVMPGVASNQQFMSPTQPTSRLASIAPQDQTTVAPQGNINWEMLKNVFDEYKQKQQSRMA